MERDVYLLEIFGAGPGGGNPAPIVADAAGLSDADMRRIAQAYRLESGFVLPAPEGSGCDFEARFFVPNHEMEMCGHATVGAVWLMRQLGKSLRSTIAIATKSGRVDARVEVREGDLRVEISQPCGVVRPLADGREEEEVLAVLGLGRRDLSRAPMVNACTSRVKTLVALASVAALDSLQPDAGRIEEVCDKIGSTGLYPYAAADDSGRIFAARQFPRSSGYLEDAATGIAAAALAFGLLQAGAVHGGGRPILVRQGHAMGRPSEIQVRFRTRASGEIDGCWIGGSVRLSHIDRLEA